MHAYEGLTRYNAKYEVEPALATKWTFISPTQVRFELRKGVKFHDGSPFTADDVLFSFDRIRQPQGTMGIYVTGISEIKKVDSHTVDFILAAPNPILLRNIIDFRIMSKAWAEKNNSAKVQDYKAKEENFASRNVMGTGSYRITGWTPDQRITMTANPDWWDKRDGNVTEVIYTPIASPATRVAALLSGDVDMLTDLPTQDVARLKSDAKLKVVEGPEVRTIYLAPDVGSPELKYSSVKGKNPFADKRVRQALSLAIDREAIRRSTMSGLSIPAALMVAPGVNGYDKALDKHDIRAVLQQQTPGVVIIEPLDEGTPEKPPVIAEDGTVITAGEPAIPPEEPGDYIRWRTIDGRTSGSESNNGSSKQIEIREREEEDAEAPGRTKKVVEVVGNDYVASDSAVRKFRIAVLWASRSLLLTITLMSGFSALNFSMAASNADFGPGFRSSKLMTRSAAIAVDVSSAPAAVAASVCLNVRNMVSSQMVPE